MPHEAAPVTERIEWHEGMLLAPQHFQQLSARIDSLVAWQTLAAMPFAWGVRDCRFDPALLAAGWIRVLKLDAILPDGTAVSHDAAAEPQAALEIALAPFAGRWVDGPLDVWLILPVAVAPSTSEPSRFRSVTRPPVEDLVSDAVAADIPRQCPRLALAVGPTPGGAYVRLRLGRVRKDGDIVGFDGTLPPLLEIGQGSELWRAASELCGRLRGKAAFMARQVTSALQSQDRLTRLELGSRLRDIVAGLPLCEAVLRTRPLHPLPLYWALASLSGSLALLEPGGLPPPPPPYDHADPSRVFMPLLAMLDGMIADISQAHRAHEFEWHDGAFEIELKPEWVAQPRLIVGLHGPVDEGLRAWMAGAIIGGRSVLHSLRERRILGAQRQPIEQADELGLRAGSGFLLQSVQTRPDLMAPGDRLVVCNPGEGAQATRPRRMVLFTCA